MPWHSSRNRVNSVGNFNALCREQVCQFPHGVLGLGDRESETGHDHHAASVGQEDGDIVGGA
ncbi:unannotated protein [freshwater metagenome]|uniref:Unannotated protein n=1 Tax=freshwater metagenome TaxID=449393 RepID=A0A6J7VG46_9ZZZZ